MKRMMIVLFMISLLQIPNVIARKGVPEPEVKGGSALSSGESLKPETESNLLFFKFPAHQSNKGPQELEFRFRVDNLPYMVEQITIGESDARSRPTIEVLSKYPLRRKNLHLLAKTKTHQVRVIVLINRQVVQEFSFAEFLTHSRKLKARRNLQPLVESSNVIFIRPLKAEGDISIAGFVSDPYCTGDCYNQYANCAEWDCGSPYVECDSCYPQLNACLNDCPLICIPDVTVEDRGDEVGCDDYDPRCVGNFVQYTHTCLFRLYTLRRTVYCDGSVDEEETNVHYERQFTTIYTNVWCN
jgi:hypothetical protein